jgi:glycosyltransferase involved in cell wall biosynthesis
MAFLTLTRKKTRLTITITCHKAMEYSLDLSIIVPLFNENESLPELASWIERVMDKNGCSYEVIMVDDGSTDGSWNTVRALAARNQRFRGISFRRNYGKSAALYCGFKEARGRVVVTMDADLQDSPEEIPQMYRMVTEEGWDIVSGWKQHRVDNKFTKNLPSKLYNATARAITGVKLHDMNCGLKAYKNEVVKSIEVYGEMHRYIPYLAKNEGFTKITEKPVHHQKRKYGKSKFGMERFVNGFLDLLSLWFLSTFGKKPMHFFGFTGILMFFVGFVMSVWMIAAKLIRQARDLHFRPVTDQPLFYLALTAVLAGIMLFLAGFICEMVSRNSSERNRYNIKEEI